MAGSENNLWGQHDLSRVCFGLDMDHSLRGLHKDFGSLSQSPYFPDSYLSSEPLRQRPPLLEGDQVVPSSAQRGSSVLGQRETKPLPPLPDPEELMSDEAADQEVEFFTSDRRCLLPKPFPKVPCKGSSKQNGKVNLAYQDASLLDRDVRNLAFSWPGCDDRGVSRSGHFGACNWDSGDAFWTKPEPCLPPKTRLSCVVPPVPTDKPEVPPRIPIKPKNLSLTSDDKPPKIPPRVPLVPPCPPRTPSPKSLPIYINGVMPATQSFAANPNYVSKTLQRHHSERVAPSPSQASASTPCIVPILRDGRQASTTHYILLPPGQSASANNRRERIQSEPTRKSNGGFWKKR